VHKPGRWASRYAIKVVPNARFSAKGLKDFRDLKDGQKVA
jgi:hypothetical protein